MTFRCRLVRTMIVLLASLASSASAGQERDAELDRLLEMGIDKLGEIVVTSASKKAQRVIDAPATVRVITDEQIRERGYLTLEQALADLPGIQFRNPMSLNSYVFIRGVPNQNNLALVLVDGLEINELNSGGFYGGGQYNLSNVKRIEVVYGPASALYGTNAMSGVINIVTKDPEDSPGLQVNGAYGGFRTGLGGLQYGYYDPQSRFGLRVSGMLKTTRCADLKGASNNHLWTPDLDLYEDDRSFDVKLRFREFLLTVTYQNRESSSATYYPSVGTDYVDHGTRWNLRFVNVALQHRIDLSDAVTLQSRVYARETTVLDDSVREVTSTGQVGFFRPNYRLGADILVSARLHADWSLIGGAVFEHDWLANGYSTTRSASPEERPPAPSWPAMARDYLVSAYLQLQYTPVRVVDLTAGLHFDYSSVYSAVVAPRFGAVFQWQGLFAKALYGEAFRAPKPWDYTDGAGNSGLDPERMRSVEVSFGYLYRDVLRIETSVYWNRLYDVIAHQALTGASGGANWRWANSGRIDTIGVEAGVEGKAGPVRAFANYTYTRSRDEHGAVVPEIAEHGANVGLSCRFLRKIGASLWGEVLGPRPNPKVITATGSNRIDPAFVMNASVSFLDLHGFDFQIAAFNLLDTAYYHPSNRDPDRYRQPQRRLMAKASYRF